MVELTHLRIEQQFEGSATLNDTIGEVVSVLDGTGKKHEPDEEPLSLIIEQINERFGTSWDPTDRLFFDAVPDKLVRRPDIEQQAAAKPAGELRPRDGQAARSSTRRRPRRTSRSSTSTTLTCRRWCCRPMRR